MQAANQTRAQSLNLGEYQRGRKAIFPGTGIRSIVKDGVTERPFWSSISRQIQCHVTPSSSVLAQSPFRASRQTANQNSMGLPNQRSHTFPTFPSYLSPALSFLLALPSSHCIAYNRRIFNGRPFYILGWKKIALLAPRSSSFIRTRRVSPISLLKAGPLWLMPRNRSSERVSDNNLKVECRGHKPNGYDVFLVD